MSMPRNRVLTAIALFAILAIVIAGCTPSQAQPEVTRAPAVPTPSTSGSGTDGASATTSALPTSTTVIAIPSAQATSEIAPLATVESIASPGMSTAEPMATASMSTVEPMATSEAAGTPEVMGTTDRLASVTGVNQFTLKAVEYSYEAPDSTPAGWTRITLDNQGQKPHGAMILKVEAGKTFTEVMQALAGNGPPDWVDLYGGTQAEAGKTASYVVDLKPGTYFAISFSGGGPNSQPDAMRGMVHQFEVTGAEGSSNVVLPQADATVQLVDYAFVVTGTIPAGQPLLRVENNGKELHELVIYRLKPGKTIADFQAALKSEMAGTPTPEDQSAFEEAGGTFASPGVTVYSTFDLPAGDYVFICHIPSPANNMQPHFQLGMIKEVVVK